jgi:hypothetical protein
MREILPALAFVTVLLTCLALARLLEGKPAIHKLNRKKLHKLGRHKAKATRNREHVERRIRKAQSLHKPYRKPVKDWWD